MQTPRIHLAQNGPEFSRIALGLWRLKEWQLSAKDLVTFLEQCIDLGITSIDHADIYGDYQVEALFGEALVLAPNLRKRIEIVSKCGIKLVSQNRPAHQLKSYDTSRAHIIASVDNSLQCMRSEYLDLLLIHRPDPLMDVDEMAEAFRSLQDAGKVRHFGVSNFNMTQFSLLASRFSLVTNQIELSVLHTDALHDGTLDQCQGQSIVPMVWSALAGGRLFSEKNLRAELLRTTLAKIGAEYGVSATTIAYAWILRHPSKPLPLTGSQRISAIREAVAATQVTLTREQWFDILRASTGVEIP